MRNVYKKWKINSAKMNKAICAEWDGKLWVLSRDSTIRTGTGERLFVFSDMQEKNGENPGQMDKKIPVSFDTGIFCEEGRKKRREILSNENRCRSEQVLRKM